MIIIYLHMEIEIIKKNILVSASAFWRNMIILVIVFPVKYQMQGPAYYRHTLE